MVVPWKFSKCHEKVILSSAIFFWKDKKGNVRVGSYTKGNSNKILIFSPNTTKFKDLAWRGNCRTFLFVQRDPVETHSNEGSTVSWLMSWRSKRKRKRMPDHLLSALVMYYWVLGLVSAVWIWVMQLWEGIDIRSRVIYVRWNLISDLFGASLVSHGLVWYHSMYGNVSVPSVLCRLRIRSILHFTSLLHD